MLQTMAIPKARDLNIGHALINVFVSADVVTGRANLLSNPPTVIYERSVQRGAQKLDMM